MKTLSIIIDIILSIVGIALVFNESDTFTPNIIALACFALLIYKHRNDPEKA